MEVLGAAKRVALREVLVGRAVEVSAEAYILTGIETMPNEIAEVEIGRISLSLSGKRIQIT